MSGTVTQARDRCVETFDDSAARPGNEAAFSSDLDALIAAVRAEERARVVALIASEECAHDLAHTVDDVNPRKSHTGDQADAAIYCKHIANYLLTGADQ